MPGSRRRGSASTALTRLVLDTYGTDCWLRLPGCSYRATTKDHVVPLDLGGTDDLDNLRPACRSCNSKRRNLAMSGLAGGPVVTVLVGPPAGGKSTHVREHAAPHDLVIDLDDLARALMPTAPSSTHTYPEHVRWVAIAARRAAIEKARRLSVPCGVWIIDSMPKPETLAEYRGLHYRVLVIDPGRELVEQRARAERPAYIWPHVARWYDLVAPSYAPLGLVAAGAPAPELVPPAPSAAGSAGWW